MRIIKTTIYVLAVIIAVIIVFVVTNLAVNWIIGEEPPFGLSVNGSTSDWHNYLGVMISTFISALVPFIILFLTIKDNSRNRSQQFYIIQYQLYLNIISSYKKSINEVLNFFTRSRVENLGNLVAESISINRDELAEDIKNSAKIIANNFKITFAGPLDDNETKFVEDFKQLYDRYLSRVEDIMWLANTNFGNDEWDNPVPHTIIEECDKYRKQFDTVEQHKKYRIWNILQPYISESGIKLERFIPDSIVLLLQSEETENFYDKAIDFLAYENIKVNRILNHAENR